MFLIQRLLGGNPPPPRPHGIHQLTETDRRRIGERRRSDPTVAEILSDQASPPTLLERLLPEDRRRCERQHAENSRQALNVRRLVEHLQASRGVPPFNPADPSGEHYCWRFDGHWLELRPHQTFLARQKAGCPRVAPPPAAAAADARAGAQARAARRHQLLSAGFQLHLSENGLMAQRDDHWIPDPDEAYFAALDAAAHPSGTFRT